MNKKDDQIAWPDYDPKEAYRSFFEALKHTTTLNSAALIILATFMRATPDLNPITHMFVIICACCLVISLVFCLLGMFSVGSVFEQQWGRSFVHFCVGISFAAFTISMAMLALVVISNSGSV